MCRAREREIDNAQKEKVKEQKSTEDGRRNNKVRRPGVRGVRMVAAAE